MNKKLIVLLCLFIVVTSFGFASVDIELPVDCMIARTELPLDNHATFSSLYSYCAFGPARAFYIFDDEKFAVPEKFTFGVGGGFFPWPFQVFTASGIFNYEIANFNEKGSLEISNCIDVGLLCNFYNYYDVVIGQRTTKAYTSLALAYSLNLIYRNPFVTGFYIGGGFYVGGAKYFESIMLSYGIDVVFGYRIKTQK